MQALDVCVCYSGFIGLVRYTVLPATADLNQNDANFRKFYFGNVFVQLLTAENIGFFY